MSKPASDDLDLPKALVRRLVKGKLSSSDPDGKDVQLNKDALLAFSESAKVFITYLSSTANEICKEAKRSTIRRASKQGSCAHVSRLALPNSHSPTPTRPFSLPLSLLPSSCPLSLSLSLSLPPPLPLSSFIIALSCLRTPR